MLDDCLHIPISLLWEYSRDPKALDWTHMEHLVSCENCVGILWLSYTSETVTDLKRRLGAYALSSEVTGPQ